MSVEEEPYLVHDFEPGEVAMINTAALGPVLAMLSGDRQTWLWVDRVGRNPLLPGKVAGCHPRGVTARRVAVVEYGDVDKVREIAWDMYRQGNPSSDRKKDDVERWYTGPLQAALQAAAKPRMREPGDWAVVEAATPSQSTNRREWVRHPDGVWYAVGVTTLHVDWDWLVDPVLIRGGMKPVRHD